MGSDLHADEPEQRPNENFAGEVLSAKSSLPTIPLLPELFP